MILAPFICSVHVHNCNCCSCAEVEFVWGIKMQHKIHADDRVWIFRHCYAFLLAAASVTFSCAIINVNTAFFCTYCPENLKQINLSVIFHWTCLSDCLLFDLNSWMSWDIHQCLCIFPSKQTELVYCISMRNWACDLCVVYWLYVVITKLEMLWMCFIN